MCIVVQYSHKSVRPVQTGTEVCESVVSVAEKGCFADVSRFASDIHTKCMFYDIQYHRYS